MQMHDYAGERQRTLSSEPVKMEGREARKETEKGAKEGNPKIETNGGEVNYAIETRSYLLSAQILFPNRIHAKYEIVIQLQFYLSIQFPLNVFFFFILNYNRGI